LFSFHLCPFSVCQRWLLLLYLQGASRVQAHWLSVSSVPFHLLDLRLRRLALGVSKNALLALRYHLCYSPQINLTSAAFSFTSFEPLFSFSASRRFASFRLFNAWWLICYGLFLINLVLPIHPFQAHRTASLSRPLSVIRTLVKLKHKVSNRLFSSLQWLTSALHFCVGQLPQTALLA